MTADDLTKLITGYNLSRGVSRSADKAAHEFQDKIEVLRGKLILESGNLTKIAYSLEDDGLRLLASESALKALFGNLLPEPNHAAVLSDGVLLSCLPYSSHNTYYIEGEDVLDIGTLIAFAVQHGLPITAGKLSEKIEKLEKELEYLKHVKDQVDEY